MSTISNSDVSLLCKQDTNSCSVYAISNAFDISYEEAFIFCEKVYNREIKKGVSSYIFNDRNNMISNHRISYYGKNLRKVDNKHFSCGKMRLMTVMTFISKHPLGTFILGVRGHTFVIKDSIIYGIEKDNKKLKTRVQECWEVYDSKSPSVIPKRKKILRESNPNTYEKGDYIFLDRHIFKKGSKWHSKLIIIFGDNCTSFSSVEHLTAKNLSEMENKIKESFYIK